MYRLFIAALPLLFLFSQSISCQEDSAGSKIVSGIIVDDSTGQVLPSVHLWNERSKMGTVSDESGAFRIFTIKLDTLAFSALGYYTDTVIIYDSLWSAELLVRLKPKKYELEEVVVRRWNSYAAFKHDFLNLELPDSEIEPLKANLKVSAITAAVEADRERSARDKADGFGVSAPLGKGVNVQRERQKELDRMRMRQKIIREKFNRALVADLTDLEGDALTEFIASCNFSDDYLYRSDLYTIIEALYAKFDVYQSRTDSISSSLQNTRN